MNELIQMNTPTNGAIALLNLHDDETFPVDGRELHQQLGVDTPYRKWFPRMCEYGFEDGKDFSEVSDKNVRNPLGGRPETNHRLTLSMAKEICMLQRSEMGRAIRQYLIAVEDAWNRPEMLMARALRMADKKIKVLEGNVVELEAQRTQLLQQAESDAPKVLFAKSVESSNSEILVGEMAKILRQNGFNVGQNRFFEILRRDGYLISRKGADWNMPTQRSMELGIMRIKETSITHADGHTTVSRTPKITGKGQIYFVDKYIRTKTA